jgi:hypothetical protein
MPDRYPELTSSIVSLLYDLDYKFADILARITGHLRYHVNCLSYDTFSTSSCLNTFVVYTVASVIASRAIPEVRIPVTLFRILSLTPRQFYSFV